MLVELTALHWIYVLFIVLIIGFMVMRRDTTLISTLGIFLIAIVATADFTASVSGVFKSFVFATTELLSTILIICIIVAMSKVLQKTGINEVMVTPFTKIFKTPGLAFWTIGILMMVISWFFWPSPAVALLGAVMLPVAIRAGLPALGVAMAMNLFGHGIALSSDFIIQGAPKLTADAAGIPVTDVVMASIPLVIVMGVVTTLVAFFLLKRDMKRGSMEMVGTFDGEHVEEKPEDLLSLRQKQIFAVLIPVAFILDVVAMAVFNLSGGDATAIVGGTAIFILLILSMFAYKNDGLEKTTSHLIEGFQFGFKVFGPVIPIAAFFYMGDAGFTSIIGEFLPTDSQGIVNDLGIALASVVPLTSEIAAITLTGVGAITGLDGSGFSGITLAGSIANLFGTAIESGTATLTALGQIAAIWVGGGTLVPWALIPAAAICNVSPFELARRNLIPVVVGLIVTTIVAMFII
ncbi:membrane protein [Ureibacillus massiliensis 4400831 = CIP 108448 = CCUG 49529]|uniref:Membrane protein n=1 Tax=Ureibacillus massiliensis 4400831 = CIP 108448 = CCUG 49529 TaxID=1211035 RepID=A0A0A3IZF8_9BACL|nr:membrane protein [Ureibacillus massiliensis]KGR90111.1 membrane protein [Ureibacillus massiliensis 4400831 = CIP 108448 = CCUG 49529]